MNNETFVYMGGDMVVPQDVVRVRVDPSVTVIPEKAFFKRGRLREVELCDGLQEIGSYAFGMSWDNRTNSYRSALKQISIPSSVRLIGDYAFRHCKKLEEVMLCEGLLEIGERAFSSCTALKRIEIPSSVRTFGSYAFNYCIKLEEVDLREGLLEIGRHAFDSCNALKSIKIPSTVTIHEWAFACCDKLEEVTISEGLLEIGSMAFFECTSLKQIRIPSTVSSINRIFKECTKLEKVELSEGLVEIGEHSFYGCYSLESINIPSTVKTISCWAFAHVPLKNLSLPDNIERIEEHAFWNWNEAFAIARLPSLITTITGSMCHSRSLFSMELSESIKRFDDEAFGSCMTLRNLALPPHVETGIDVFKDCLDLKQLGSERNIIKLLKHRFDNLPIHRILYYQSYNQGRVLRSNNESLISTLDDPSIKRQDSLGMTPLHILACSTVQNVELYKMFIEKHPESLITKDRWGALPLLYAVWRDAGKDIVQLLVQSYKSIFPNYVFNFTKMMETLGRVSVKGDMIKCLHLIQFHEFPNQCIDFDALVEKAITCSNPDNPNFITEYSLRCLAARRIIFPHTKLLKIKTLYNELGGAAQANIPESTRGRRDFVKQLQEKFDACLDKHNRMMEALTSIELVLWKNKMDDCCGQQNRTRRSSKKMRMDDSAMRKQCRLKCGAETNIVIEHVLPYLDIL